MASFYLLPPRTISRNDIEERVELFSWKSNLTKAIQPPQYARVDDTVALSLICEILYTIFSAL